MSVSNKQNTVIFLVDAIYCQTTDLFGVLHVPFIEEGEEKFSAFGLFLQTKIVIKETISPKIKSLLIITTHSFDFDYRQRFSE